ncbi:MAG TPA: hypothetical protein VF095_02760 [Bacillota bacterium]
MNMVMNANAYSNNEEKKQLERAFHYLREQIYGIEHRLITRVEQHMTDHFHIRCQEMVSTLEKLKQME